jgi:hypothetical protein
MTQSTELWVKRKDLRETRIVRRELPPLDEGQVRVAIDMFGLTANNVSYAVVGDSIGYWGYYPAEDDWGKVPAWGCADVVESRCDGIGVGERLWGFFPMASHVDLVPGNIRQDQFIDIAQHRQALPPLYNGYRRTGAEPEFLRQMEVERCLLFPLFITSYFLYDRLVDNAFFGAAQVVIGSVSSKTGFGLAQMLHDDAGVNQRVIGVTSAANVEFVEGLGCCDQVLVYGEEERIDASLPTAYVDMSGDVRLTRALHRHIGENLVESCIVGATHWEEGGDPGELPGARPEFFFAPAQIAKRDQEWGPGAAMARAGEASALVAAKVKDSMSVEWTRGVEGLQALWLDMLDNRVSAQTGQMVSLRG